jgi:hypothetical protein
VWSNHCSQYRLYIYQSPSETLSQDEHGAGFDALEAEATAFECSTLSATAMLDFLDCANLMYVRNRDREYPYEFVKPSGKNAFDLLEYVSGKKVFAKEKTEKKDAGAGAGAKRDSSAGKKEEAAKLLKQYEDALTFLKQHGALLNTVRAEHLLSLAQYQRVLSTRRPKGVKRTKQQAKREKAALDRSFPTQVRLCASD